jgi:hypothetical protein
MTDQFLHANFLERVKTKILNEAKLHALELGYGEVSSMEEYKNRCGVIKGLDKALDLVEQVVEEIRKEER